MKSISRLPRISKAEAVLILITMLWGGTFLLVQHALTVSGPMLFVGLRFAAAALIVALFSMKVLRGLTFLELKAGVFIGTAISRRSTNRWRTSMAFLPSPSARAMVLR